MTRFALILALLAACGGNKVPETRYYQIAPASPAHSEQAGDEPVSIVLEPLTTDPAYDDERIVYRTSPYRLDYYQYHRWSAAPGTMVSNYLETALEKSGRFRAVTRELSADSPVVLGGRVVAIEEVDDSRARWRGRIVIELTLTDVKSNKPVWSEQFEETEPLSAQTPEGLAKALSAAMGRVVAKAAPAIESTARATQLNARR